MFKLNMFFYLNDILLHFDMHKYFIIIIIIIVLREIFHIIKLNEI
jgi:hypothetical protein